MNDFRQVHESSGAHANAEDGKDQQSVQSEEHQHGDGEERSYGETGVASDGENCHAFAAMMR